MGILEEKIKKEHKTRRRRRIAEAQEVHQPFDYGRLGKFMCFAIFALMVAIICFVGRSSVGSKLLLKQMAKTRVVAEFPFSFHSDLKTEQIANQKRQMVPPVYRIDKALSDSFNGAMLRLAADLNSLQKNIGDLPSKEKSQRIKDFTREFSVNNNINLNKENVTTILEKTSAKEREYIFSEAILVFKEIMRAGVYSPSQLPFALEADGPYFSNIEIEGHSTGNQPKNEEDSLKALRLNLSSMGLKTDVSKALFHIFKNGVVHNLTYDPAKSETRIKEALRNVEPVQVHVSQGQVIVEPDSIATPEEYEMLNAYLRESQEREGGYFIMNAHLINKMAATFLVLAVAILYLNLNFPNVYRSNRLLLFIGVIVLLGLLLNRAVLHLEEATFLNRNMGFMAAIPYAVPLMFGPILVSSILGVGIAVLVASIICSFNTLMQGADLVWFFVYLLSSFTAIYFSQKVKLRSKLIKATLYGGIVLGIGAVILGIYDSSSLEVLLRKFFFSVFGSVAAGVLAVSFLPFVEAIFKQTSDIRLLELIDFNHPLLKRLQIEAPGTYHHSLMVATLAERAASDIGANALACRACALFHDIGKLVKPEYFVENQRDGHNPHNEKNPSMSALIIKSHVKEGLEMAKEARLPKIILDVIEQHHGTTLIQYFYTKAVRQRRHSQDPFSIDAENTAEEVDESIFRYDGPSPQFKESAIIFFADSIEAASRSLKKVTPQSVQELISTIFQERIDDKQLDESPLTMQEIRQIKASFTFTLLNMMHSRVEYPKERK